MTDLLQSYESTPYKTLPHWQTHPDSLAAVSILAGLSPANPHNCRVLELGCATGGNLIPLACAFPNSHFLGLDLAPSQIASANCIVHALNLPNIAFRAMDLLDVAKDLGAFDYILCHGVFSWVPTPVRDKILWIIQNLLAENGAAFISHNAYPGWHLRSIARDLMAFHANRFNTPADKIAQVRDLMEKADKTVGDRESVYSRILSDEARILADADEYYLLHEHLDPINQPYYFHEFCALLKPYNLCWIGEVPFNSSHVGRHGKSIDELAHQCSSDPLEREQYLDFLINRQFRRSAITHQRLLHWDFSKLDLLRYSAELKWEDQEGGTVNFEASNGRKISTNHPGMIALLKCLGQAWPNTVPFDTIPADANVRRSMVKECVLNGVLRIHYRPVEPAAVSTKPLAFEFARKQAADNVEAVTNLKHHSVPLPTFDARVLTLCDGEHDASQIADEIWKNVQQGAFEMTRTDNDEKDRQMLLSQVQLSLTRLYRASLLAG